MIAFDVLRPPLQLSASTARAVLAGNVARWSELGQTGGHLVVRHGKVGLAAVSRGDDGVAIVPASEVTPLVQVATVAVVDPLLSPARYPLHTSAGNPPHTVTTMTVVGDIMLGRGVAAAHPNRLGAPLAPLRQRLARADLTIGNLESTLSTAGAPRQGTDSFAADPAVLRPLARAGFDLLSQANNHSGDYGRVAMLRTLRAFHSSPIAEVGAGRDAREAWRPVILRHDGVRFGFLAFNAIGETPRASAASPGAAEIRMEPRTGPLNLPDLHREMRAVRRLDQRVDVSIVLPHWGDQYTNQPVPDQRRVGAALVRAGADLVVGGHAHWVQGVETHAGRLIVNCLGNFVFDMNVEMDFPRQTREGVLLELVFWDDHPRGARFTPYVIGADYAPRLAGPQRAATILARMRAASDPPFRD